MKAGVALLTILAAAAFGFTACASADEACPPAAPPSKGLSGVLGGVGAVLSPEIYEQQQHISSQCGRSMMPYWPLAHRNRWHVQPRSIPMFFGKLRPFISAAKLSSGQRAGSEYRPSRMRSSSNDEVSNLQVGR
jgi:hypothetical protein